jgi:hypothetical protein
LRHVFSPRRGLHTVERTSLAAEFTGNDSTLRGTRPPAPFCCNLCFSMFAEEFLEKSLCPLETLLGEDHRFGFTPRVCDVPLCGS